MTDGTHTANIALLPDGHGGTNVVDPQMLGGVQPLVTPPHA